MAISFVGSNVTVSPNTFQPTILSLPASVPGDLVLVFMGCHGGTGGGPPTTAGYTSTTIDHTFTNLRMTSSYKLMGATPDTSVSFPALNVPGTSLVAGALVFRGCHSAAQPQDVPPVIIDNGETLVVAGPITPARDNGCVVIAAIGVPADATVGSVSGFLPSPSVQGTQGPITLGAAYRIAVGGAATTVTPTPWSIWATGSLVRFNAITIALRAMADIIPVTKSNVTTAGKAVTLRETTPVSKAQVAYTGKVVTISGASIDAIFVDRYKIVLTGKSVNVVDVTRAVTVTSASVLCRGGTVNPREVGFQDIPYLTVKGRGSEVFMETR